MWQQMVTTFTGVVTALLAVFSYEKIKNKDNQSITTTLAVLMTKVDTLLKMNDKMEDMEEMLIRHDQKIKNLEDTNRFAKLTEQLINGGLKDE